MDTGPNEAHPEDPSLKGHNDRALYGHDLVDHEQLKANFPHFLLNLLTTYNAQT